MTSGLKGKALIAYLLVCTVWGSSYLAIRVGVKTLPPMLFAGARYAIAGLLLGAVVVAAGQALPRGRRDWVTLVASGFLFFVTGNALVVWAEQYMESGPASVVVASVPLWTAFCDAVIPGGTTRFSVRLLGGLMVGFVGVVLLVGASPAGLARADLRGPIALIVASASWALATVITKRRPVAATPYMTAAIQMVIGGVILAAIGVLAGDMARWQFTGHGMAALAYLIVFGSIVAFTAFVYAVNHASPTLVGTYAYVNPVVAVLLGWLLLDEAITGRTVAAMALILGAVILIQFRPSRTGTAAAGAALPAAKHKETAA